MVRVASCFLRAKVGQKPQDQGPESSGAWILGASVLIITSVLDAGGISIRIEYFL